MTGADGYCLVMTTCSNDEEGASLARRLVEARLAACVQLQQVRSFFSWEGQVSVDPEVLLRIKTRTMLYARLVALIGEHHSYEIPEIVRIPIESGLPSYLGWIDEVTG